MKAHMNSHVAENRHTMFHESAEEVERQLSSLVKDVEDTLADKADEVFMQIKRDYRSVLGGGDAPPDGEVLPRVQRQVRKEVARIIDGVEKMMRKVVGLEVDEEVDMEEGNEESQVKSDETGDGSQHGTQQSNTEEAREDSAHQSPSPKPKNKVREDIQKERGQLSPIIHSTEPADEDARRVGSSELNTCSEGEESDDEEAEDDSSSASA